MTYNQGKHLKHVAIEGFKSIRSLDVSMESVNILIGANGAGKSNFISLFTFLRHLAEGRLQNYVEKNGRANTFFRFVCMATLFLQPPELRPKSVVLDEPELGLHPAALEVLADLVKSASKDNQVICSTQSVTFANQFEAENFIVVDQEQGASTFRRVDPEGLNSWLEDYAMGDIWTKNLIGGRPAW